MSGLDFRDGKLIINTDDFPANHTKGVINQIHTENSHNESDVENQLNQVSSINDSLSGQENSSPFRRKSDHSGTVESDHTGLMSVKDVIAKRESVSMWLVA